MEACRNKWCDTTASCPANTKNVLGLLPQCIMMDFFGKLTQKGEDAMMGRGASPARLDELDVRGGMRVAGPWKVRAGPFSDGSL